MSSTRATLCLAGILVGSHAAAQSTSRVSVDSSGHQGSAPSYGASLSEDARYVAFYSEASNLVPADGNGLSDVFVHDRQSGTTLRASVDSSGAEANGESYFPMLSGDGRWVVFVSTATNLVPADTNGREDIFLHDLESGTTRRVSVSSGGAEANFDCFRPFPSRDGRFVAFATGASTLVPGDTNNAYDVFVHDGLTSTTTRVSVDSTGLQGNGSSGSPSLSSDGRYVAFDSNATNLVPGDVNGVSDVYVHDRLTGSTERVSVDSSGTASNGYSFFPAITPDARYVLFQSGATNLVPGDTHGVSQVYVHDRQTGETVCASAGPTGDRGNADCLGIGVSADGRFAAFNSQATNLLPVNTAFRWRPFVRDLETGAIILASLSSSAAQANSDCFGNSLSADGRFVGFFGDASNLVPGDTNHARDAFVRDVGLPTVQAFCFGDGTGSVPCPCGNEGANSHGCENSLSTGGAIETFAGTPSVSDDSLVLTSAGERPTSLSIFLQGSLEIAPTAFGDGLRCTGGSLKRLYTKSASGGVVTAPSGSDSSVTARSAALGSPISPDDTRLYQVYYRDPSATFCPDPPGNTFNVSNGLRIFWGS